jgi:hypothetical protein
VPGLCRRRNRDIRARRSGGIGGHVPARGARRIDEAQSREALAALDYRPECKRLKARRAARCPPPPKRVKALRAAGSGWSERGMLPTYRCAPNGIPLSKIHRSF